MQYTENKNLEPQASDFEQDFSLNLFDYLKVIAKRWKMILCLTFCATVITAIFTMFMPNIYAAKTLIIPGDDDKGGMGALMAQLGGLAAIASGTMGAKATGELYITMLKSETIKDSIIDKFNLMVVYKGKYRADVYGKLDAKTAISLGKKDGVLSIVVSDKDPVMAAAIANAYADELGKLAGRLNMAKASDNRNFLEKRLIEARADLTKAEDVLKAFQAKNKVVSLDQQAQGAISGIAQLRALLASREVELGTLLRQFTDTSQEVKIAKSTITNLKTQISRLEGKGDGSSSIPSVGSIPQIGQEYLRIMREFKIQEAVLEMLTKQYEAVKISEYKDVSPLQVLQKAKVPEKKSKPVRSKIVKLALLLSLSASILLAFAIEKWGAIFQILDMKRLKMYFSGNHTGSITGT